MSVDGMSDIEHCWRCVNPTTAKFSPGITVWSSTLAEQYRERGWIVVEYGPLDAYRGAVAENARLRELLTDARAYVARASREPDAAKLYDQIRDALGGQ